jgi:hypothetical protein
MFGHLIGLLGSSENTVLASLISVTEFATRASDFDIARYCSESQAHFQPMAKWVIDACKGVRRNKRENTLQTLATLTALCGFSRKESSPYIAIMTLAAGQYDSSSFLCRFALTPLLVPQVATSTVRNGLIRR